MKTIIYLIAILILMGCQQAETDTIISVLNDVTDQHISNYHPSQIHQNFGLNQNKWGGYLFRYQSLTGSDYNQIRESILPSENQLLGNSIDRKQKYKLLK